MEKHAKISVELTQPEWATVRKILKEQSRYWPEGVSASDAAKRMERLDGILKAITPAAAAKL